MPSEHAPGSPEAIAELAAICGLEWRGQCWTLHAGDGVRRFFDYPDNWNPYECAVHTEMLMAAMKSQGWLRHHRNTGTLGAVRQPGSGHSTGRRRETAW